MRAITRYGPSRCECRAMSARLRTLGARHGPTIQPSSTRNLHTFMTQGEKSPNIIHHFFTPRSSGSRGNKPDPADIGRTIQILTTRLPHLLSHGSLPQDILSETITLELLPSTLGLPEIQGKTAYTTLVKLGTWSVTTLFPNSVLMIDAQKLIGSARSCEKLTVRFRLVDAAAAAAAAGSSGGGNKTVYTGLFHFHFDSNGKISRHIFEIVDDGYSPSLLVNWLVGARNQEKNLGYCYERYDKK